MDDDRAIDADFLRERFGLQPHPTCGFVAETYRSATRVPVDGLPAGFDGDRPLGSALHFLVTADTLRGPASRSAASQASLERAWYLLRKVTVPSRS